MGLGYQAVLVGIWTERKKEKSLSCVQLFATPWTVSQPSSFIHGIFQARVLEWGAIAFSMQSNSRL